MSKPSAPDEIERCRAQFAADGYLALSAYFSLAELDAADAATEEALRTRVMEIVVDSLNGGERTLFGLARAPESLNFKYNDLYLIAEGVRRLVLERQLTVLLRALFGGTRPVLCNTLTLVKGTTQAIHIDSLFMTPQTPRHLLAAWIAFEDVDPAAGPLVYYPGSHQIPLYRFRDGSHHGTPDELPDWERYIENEIEQRGLERKTFLARKGDVFIWHSDLAHGGSAIQDPEKTRRSLVCHYYTEYDSRKIAEWRLDPLNEGFWLNRLPAPVRPPPDRFDDLHPFPEEAYFRRNPDLRAALQDSQITSGFAHYCSHGYAEGRAI